MKAITNQQLTKGSLIFFCLLTSSLLTGCYSLQPVTISHTSSDNQTDWTNYKYFYIIPSATVSSVSGVVCNGYGASSTRSVNPSEEIAGYLQNNGFIQLPDLKDNKVSSTFIVSFARIDRRYVGLGSSLTEVLIQFMSAETDSLICSCKAEGDGDTEAQAIEKAIRRCFNALNIPNKY